MLTDQELQEIAARVEHRWDSTLSRALFAARIMTDVIALIADWEELHAEVKRLRAIIAANPVMSKSAQKRLTAQVLDATSESETRPFEDRGKPKPFDAKGRPTFQRKGYDLAGPENHHSARPERTS